MALSARSPSRRAVVLKSAWSTKRLHSPSGWARPNSIAKMANASSRYKALIDSFSMQYVPCLPRVPYAQGPDCACARGNGEEDTGAKARGEVGARGTKPPRQSVVSCAYLLCYRNARMRSWVPVLTVRLVGTGHTVR